ncbi:MAG TPA: hypothetical protein PKY78_08945 [Candidatus Omnitrophota bacterium]|nr:hypothetical protein [Candidatus Omnitrophota bacterium]HPS21097.1 hypothetical protein [Candidatus Omnitrophota bacterium]
MGIFSKTKILLLIFLLIGAAVSPAYPEDTADISAEVAKTEIAVGDRIDLQVSVKLPKGAEAIFPDEIKEPGDFSFVEMKIPKKNKRGMESRIYVLTIFETGQHVIPPVMVKFRNDQKSEWKDVSTRQIPIEVKSLLTGSETDIKGIKGLTIFGAFSWGYIITGIFIFFVVLVVLFIRNRNRAIAEEKARKRPPHEVAYEELSKLKGKDLPGHGMIKEYYSDLSDIARHYLEARFNCRAPEMTTEEFLYYLKQDGAMEAKHKELLRDFLTQCDMVKFAKYGPTPIEMIDSYKLAEKLVDETKVDEPEQAEEEKGK